MDAYLFDLGNVLLKFDFSKTRERLRRHGASMERMKGPEMTAMAQAYERGEFTDDAFIRQASALVGYRGDADTFRRSWEDIFEENQPMIDFLGGLRRQGRPCYLLSNSNGMHVGFIRRTYEVLGHFDDVIFSHEARCMKPDESIYRLAIERFGLDPARTLYIDDAPANIEAGLRLGFRCHQYDAENHAAFLDMVRANRPEP